MGLSGAYCFRTTSSVVPVENTLDEHEEVCSDCCVWNKQSSRQRADFFDFIVALDIASERCCVATTKSNLGWQNNRQFAFYIYMVEQILNCDQVRLATDEILIIYQHASTKNWDSNNKVKSFRGEAITVYISHLDFCVAVRFINRGQQVKVNLIVG